MPGFEQPFVQSVEVLDEVQEREPGAESQEEGHRAHLDVQIHQEGASAGGARQLSGDVRGRGARSDASLRTEDRDQLALGRVLLLRPPDLAGDPGQRPGYITGLDGFRQVLGGARPHHLQEGFGVEPGTGQDDDLARRFFGQRPDEHEPDHRVVSQIQEDDLRTRPADLIESVPTQLRHGRGNVQGQL
jgi:hypothetical protein